jgi:lysophospholipase
MVMTAPMLKIAQLPMAPRAMSVATTGLSLCGMGRFAVPGGMKEYLTNQRFEGNTLTGDHERFLRNLSVANAAPGLAVGPPTFGWVRSALAAMAAIESEKFPNRLRVPVLMLAAGDDRIVSSKVVEQFADRLKVGTQLLLRGSRHEILQERDLIREQFWAAFDAFVPGAVTSRLGEPVVA